MFMKILNIAIALFMGQTTAPAETTGFLANFTMASLRKIMMIFAGSVAALILFFGGFVTVLMDMVLSTREMSQLALSQASIVGFSMILLSVLGFAFLFSRKAWALQPVQQKPVEPQVNPVQVALADLIHDFTQERKFAREREEQAYQMMAEAEEAAAAAAAAQSSVHMSAMSTETPIAGTETYPANQRPAYN